jgi:hypothetical protein
MIDAECRAILTRMGTQHVAGLHELYQVTIMFSPSFVHNFLLLSYDFVPCKSTRT